MFVYAEVAGRPPADAIVDLEWDRLVTSKELDEVRPLKDRTWLSPGGGEPWSVPGDYQVVWAGEGEWDITLDVFRDLGLAFGAALLGIFILLMFQTGSQTLPILIMLAIPLTMIGIMPGILVAQRHYRSPNRRLSEPGFLYRNGYDRHDCIVRNRR